MLEIVLGTYWEPFIMGNELSTFHSTSNVFETRNIPSIF